MPFLVIFFVSNYGKRKITIDIDEIGEKKIDGVKTYVEGINMKYFINDAKFMNFYNANNVIED